MKYIAINVKTNNINTRLVIAFPNDLVHSLVAESMTECCKRQWPKSSVTTYSAGEITMKEIQTFGHSESLGLEADSTDARTLLSSDYGGHRC